MPAKTQFSEITLKIYLSKRENAFEKLNHISFVSWAVTENPNFRDFVISLARKKTEHLNLGCLLLFANWAERLNYVPQNWGTSKNFQKKWTLNQKLSFWIHQKSELLIAVSEKIRADRPLFQRWFLALKKFVFSAVQSSVSAVHRFSGNEQRWNRPEIILNQSWSALNVSETSTRE